MASNELPKGLDELFTLAEDMIDGLHNDGLNPTPIAIKQNTEADMRAAKDAAFGAQEAFLTARGAKKPLSEAITIADSNGKSFIALTRNVLKPALGNDWSETWLPTGFPNQSLALPETIQERQTLLQALQDFLTNNDSLENAPLNVTATRASQLFEALSTARSMLNNHLNFSGQKQLARNLAVIALRKRMTGLIDELGQLLEDDDPRWLAFGLNMPAAPEVPDIPDAPVLTQVDDDSVMVDWGDVARATRYRVWRLIVGTDEDFVAVATVQDSDATLDNLPSGVTIRIRVTAANDTGESQPSPISEIVLS